MRANGPSQVFSDAAEVLNLFPSTFDGLCLEQPDRFLGVFGFSFHCHGFIFSFPSPHYLTLKLLPSPSVPQSPSFFSHLSLFDPHFSLFSLSCSLAVASQTSACRDFLHLQHTWGIKEGWNSLIRGRSEKRKKRRAPYRTALYLWCREILNETWGRSERRCLISFRLTSGPKQRWITASISTTCIWNLIFYLESNREKLSIQPWMKQMWK